jgi:hypothetical protein
VVLDFAAVLELPDVDDAAFNDVAAVDAVPLVTVPEDSISQYLVDGLGG